MLRIAACLVFVATLAHGAFATCTEEVIAAWRRLHASGPYAFTRDILAYGSKSTVSGVIDRPKALRYRRDGAEGKWEVVRVGSRQWTFSEGRWHYEAEVSLPDLPIEQAILQFERIFGFEAEAMARQIRDAICFGRVTKDGREYSGYDYRLSKVGGALIVQERLYVDTTTGLPARQEQEERLGGPLGQLGRRVRRESEFRFDASMKVEPPVPFPQ